MRPNSQKPGSTPPKRPPQRNSENTPPVPPPAKPAPPSFPNRGSRRPSGMWLGLTIGLSAAAVLVVLAVAILVAYLLGRGSNKDDRSEEIVQNALSDKTKQDQAKAAKADQNSDPDRKSLPGRSGPHNNHGLEQPAYQPPALQQAPDQTVGAGNELSLDMAAKPGAGNGNLRYALLPPSPTAATIDPKTGKLTWQPQSNDFAKSHQFTVQVVDESRPNQKDVKTFKVTVAVPDPFVDIRNRNRTLQLPTPNWNSIQGKNEPRELAKLYLKSENLNLDLLGMEQCKQDGFAVEFKRDEGDASKWTLWQTKETPNTSGVATLVSGVKPKAVASFELDGQSLAFQWEKERPAVSLAACLLRISGNGKSETCTLTKPQKAQPIRIDFSCASQTAEAGISNVVELNIQEKDLPQREMLRLGLQLDGFPVNTFQGEALKVNEAATIRFGTWKEKIPILELVVLLLWRERDPKPSLVIKPLAFPIVLSPDGSKTVILPLPLTGDPKLARRNKSDSFVNPSYLKDECEKHLADVEKRRNAYQTAIAGLNRQRKPIVDRLAEIDAVANKLESLEKQHKAENETRKKEKLNDQINETFLRLAQLKKEIPGLIKQKQELEKQLAEKWSFLNQGKIAGENLEYVKQLSQVMEAIEQGVMHFRAFFDIDTKVAKRQVVLVETSKPIDGN